MKESWAGKTPARRDLIPSCLPIFTAFPAQAHGKAGAWAETGNLAVGTHLVAPAGEARVPLGQDALHPQEKGSLDLVLWEEEKAEVV